MKTWLLADEVCFFGNPRKGRLDKITSFFMPCYTSTTHMTHMPVNIGDDQPIARSIVFERSTFHQINLIGHVTYVARA
jgi:hypothetical protein